MPGPKRTVVKIPMNATLQEAQEIIAKLTGIPIPEVLIDKDYFNQQNEVKSLRVLIDPFFSQLEGDNTAEGSKKRRELIDFGKYILKSQRKIAILECSERPDFIIDFEGRRIGVEHTGVFNANVVAEISMYKKIVKEAEDLVRKKNPKMTGLFNIFLSVDAVTTEKRNSEYLSKAEKKLIHKQNKALPDWISTQVEAVFNKIEYETSAIFNKIVAADHKTLEIVLAEDYLLEDLSTEDIVDTITKKELKIDYYKTSQNLDACWLFVVIDGASSSSSFKILADKLPINQFAPFEETIIFNMFDGSYFFFPIKS